MPTPVTITLISRSALASAAVTPGMFSATSLLPAGSAGRVCATRGAATAISANAAPQVAARRTPLPIFTLQFALCILQYPGIVGRQRAGGPSPHPSPRGGERGQDYKSSSSPTLPDGP